MSPWGVVTYTPTPTNPRTVVGTLPSLYSAVSEPIKMRHFIYDGNRRASPVTGFSARLPTSVISSPISLSFFIFYRVLFLISHFHLILTFLPFLRLFSFILISFHYHFHTFSFPLLPLLHPLILISLRFVPLPCFPVITFVSFSPSSPPAFSLRSVQGKVERRWKSSSKGKEIDKT